MQNSQTKAVSPGLSSRKPLEVVFVEEIVVLIGAGSRTVPWLEAEVAGLIFRFCPEGDGLKVRKFSPDAFSSF